MTKANENLSNIESQENYFFQGENYVFQPKNKSRQKKQIKPDLAVSCLLCDRQFSVKYIPPKKQYSCKNNWGYWTGKETDKQKYLCNTCLVKILAGKKFDAFDWISANKAANFRSYLARGDFGKNV